MDTVDRVQEVGYVTIGTTDLDRAIEFYTQVIRLEVTERLADEAFLTGGKEHFWIRLQASDLDGVTAVGMRMADDDALSRARGRLEEHGRATTEVADPGRHRVARYVEFVDPAGQTIQLFSGMVQRHYAPSASGIALIKMLHAVWGTANFVESWAFHRDVLGFRPSDFIEQFAVFMHAADQYHHGIGLIAAPRPGFQHMCIMVDSIDDVMRARNNALRLGHKLQMDLLRHAPSTSMGVYIADPQHGVSVEFCARHRQLEQDHQPRILRATAETIDVWKEPLPSTTPPPRTATLEEMLAEHDR